MGIVIPCNIPPPHRKSNPTKVTEDCWVLNTPLYENNSNKLVLFEDGTMKFINPEMIATYKPEMLFAYTDAIGTRKFSNATRNKAAEANVEGKIEKLFTQPKDLFEAVDFSEFDIVETSEPHTPKFIEGENYALQGVACDGFKVETKVYNLIKVVDDFYGTNINSVIVKQIAGEQGVIFTLSKNDCEYHGIEYEKGLQLFPKTLNWVRVKEKIPFDKNNLATTPLSDIDNTIRFILLRLDGFRDYEDGYILTPSGHLVSEDKFVNTFRVKNKEPIVYGNGSVVIDKSILDAQLVYPKNVLFNHGNFVSSDNTIFVIIKLKRKYGNAQKERYTSIDGCFGVEPKYLEGISPNDFFEIEWDELGAYTIEEYESIKAEKARKEAERIKKIEEEHKRQIAEEEKRLKEQHTYIKSVANQMKKWIMPLPSFPDFYDVKFDGKVSTSEMIGDTLKMTFDSLNSSLNILNTDLNTITKICYENR